MSRRNAKTSRAKESHAAALETQGMIESIGHAVREAFDESDPGWSTVASGDAPATHSGGPRVWRRGISTIHDRSEGRFFPFYETERDLQIERAKWRRLATFTSVAVGAMQALQVYVMGGEWEYEWVARQDKDPPAELLKEMNVVLQATLERNDFVADLDNEVHDAAREDGETMLVGYSTDDGLVDIRRMDADNLREPASGHRLNEYLDLDPKQASWTFGVLTLFNERQKRFDHERHAGYHFIFEEDGSAWDWIPAWPTNIGDDELDGKFCQMIKRNVPRGAKRGISDYWPVLTHFERDDRTDTNLAVGTALLAAMPWIEEMPPTASLDQVKGQVSKALDTFSSLLTAKRGGETPVKNMRPGTVPKISAGRKYIAGPLGQPRSQIYLEVSNAMKRWIGLRWNMPAYMISGDATNDALASTLVAESPFVKAREADQQFFISPMRKLFTKALKVAHDFGRFRQWGRLDLKDILDLCELQIQPPPVATRDKLAQLEELFGLYDRDLMEANEVRTNLKYEPKPELDGQMKSDTDMALAEQQAENDAAAGVAVASVRAKAMGNQNPKKPGGKGQSTGARRPGSKAKSKATPSKREGKPGLRAAIRESILATSSLAEAKALLSSVLAEQ